MKRIAEIFLGKSISKHSRMNRKLSFLLFSLSFLLLFNHLFVFQAFSSPCVVVYYPSAYNLMGGTQYVSGTLANLQSDDAQYMTYRTYVTATSTTAKTDAFIAYRSNTGTSTLDSPKNRGWDGDTAAWSSENEMATAGSPIRTVRTATCPKSERALEKIVVTLSDDGNLDAYVFDGASWNVANNIGQVWSTSPSDARRPFDIAYESSSGDALLVYGTTVPSGTSDLAYRTWSYRTGWGPEQYFDDIGHSTKISVTYVALASDPNSDKIIMAYIDGTNSNVNAVVWNGSSWENFIEITSTVALPTEECLAVASETKSGAFMVVAGEGQFIKWARFASSWSPIGIFDINGGATTAMNWLKLSSSQNDRLMLTSVDGASDLCTAVWDGNSIGNRQWSTASESIGSMTSSSSVTAMRFTAQASKSVTNILVYIHTVASSPSYRFGIETSTVDYLPTGTYVGGTSNYATATPTTTGWLNVTLPSQASLTAGTVYHVTVRYNSGTISTSRYIALRRLGTLPNMFRPKENTIDPWLNTIFGTTIQDRDPIFTLKYSDGTYEAMPYDTPTAHNIYGTNWFSERWAQSAYQTILGVNIPLAVSGTPSDSLYIVLRNETNSQDIATITVPQTDITTTLQWYERYFAFPVNLMNGKTYKLILKSPSSTSSNYFICRSLLTGQSGSLTYGGTSSVYSASADSGTSWTDTNERDLTYILLSNSGTAGWIVHTRWDSSVDTNAQRCADFAWEHRSMPNYGNQGLLVYGTTSGQITWSRFRAPNYMTSATSVTMGANAHTWVQLKSNTRDIAGDVKILGAVLEGTVYDLGAIKWDGTTFTVIGTSTFTADTTTITYECFDLKFQTFGDPTEITCEVEFTGTSNTETWTQLAWTIDCSFTTASVTSTFQLFNYQTGSYPTSGDGYITDTIGTTDTTKTQTITSSPTHFRDNSGNWKLKIKGTKSTNTLFDFKADLVKLETTYPDTIPPVWSNVGTNNTIAGRPTLFHVKWIDNNELGGFIFGTNNTGRWTNETWTSMSGKTNWSNVTKILNNTATLILWRVWADDTSNNWNSTGIFSLSPLHPPVAHFSYSPLAPYTSVTVTYNASDSYDPDGTIVSYFWDFGDGTNNTGLTTTHAYADNGVYAVKLTVTDNDGLTNTETKSITVLNRPPVASFTESATTIPTGTSVYFNASTSYDPDGSIVSYFWTFGDGKNATGVAVSHSYADNGVYTVTLVVTDNDGTTAPATATKTSLNRAPVVMFTESSQTVYTGTIITFDASSSYDPDGSIVSYRWNFGDGNSTIVTSPMITHVYSENGTYVVTLMVTDNDAATASSSSTKTVLNRPPVAAFTYSPFTPYTSQPVTLDAAESYDPDGSIVNYRWSFGDGNITTITNQIVTHKYADNGVYTVTLTVADNDGATGVSSASITVLNRAPVASFTESTTSVLTGEVISFDASASYDPDGTITNYFWDFGDGKNATGVTAAHAYIDNGIYTVTLTVKDNDGAIKSATATKTVQNRHPTASFTESATTVLTGTAIGFNASSSYDADGTIVTYFWNFGDGTNATGATASHAYNDNGVYTVTLTVTDNDGATSTTTATKTVTNRSPIAAFTESATTVYTGEAIYLNASASYDPDGSIISYFWSFGDGKNATGITVNHAYADNGFYSVTLTIKDNDGGTASATASKTVLNRTPVASFTESATSVYTGVSIVFNASASYDPDGTIATYFWNFGDGTNSTGIIVYHTYSDNNVYTVTLTVTDNDGTKASSTATKTVLNRVPIASFTESATTKLTGEVIHFNGTTSYDPDGTVVSYFWTFGDGENATGVTVSHSYVNNGIYTVTLIVTDNDGATTTATATKTILNRPPVAIFTESAETVYTGTVLTFNASNSYDPDGTIVKYIWNFGDGNMTTMSSSIITHAYSENGDYMVTLTIADDDAGTASSSSTKTVLNRHPIAAFTFSPSSPHTSQPVTFNATDSYDPDGFVSTYRWNFGDGNITTITNLIVTHRYADDGTYTVMLTITDNDGATDAISTNVTVLNRVPVASFTESATTLFPGETISLDASASYDSDGTITSYFWDFGDGTNATGIVASHSYSSNGTFTVTLEVTDDDGAAGSIQATKTVLAGLPDIAIAKITPSANKVYRYQTLNISVIAANEGTTYEAFNVTLYASKVHGWHLIDIDGRLAWYSDHENSADFLIFTSTTIPTENPTLTFETKYSFEDPYDFGFIQVSTDEGLTWTSIENAYTTRNNKTDTDPDITANLPGLTGTSADWPAWKTMTFNLNNYAGQTVLLGFRYMTDLSYAKEGWYIDNIALNGVKLPNQAFTQQNPPPLNVIQTLGVNNLAPGSQTTLIFSWNTTNTLSGKYCISAMANTVKSEKDTLDNFYIDGVVEVKTNPDIDRDGDVDIFDVVTIASIYGYKEGDPRWNPKADLVEDGVINIFDLVAVASHYGETIEP